MTQGLDGKEEKNDALINSQFQPRDNRWIPWITNIDTTQLSWHLITYAIRNVWTPHKRTWILTQGSKERTWKMICSSL